MLNDMQSYSETNCGAGVQAWMLNSTSVWTGVKKLRFYLSYSNDIDAQSPGKFVGAAGDASWRRLVGVRVDLRSLRSYLFACVHCTRYRSTPDHVTNLD